MRIHTVVLAALLLALPAVALPSIEALSEGTDDGAALRLPLELRKKNIGSPYPDGPGCCVFRSLDHAARYQNVPALFAFPEWMVDRGVRGGGWPQKVSELIPRICRDRGLPAPAYLQHTNGDLELLYAAIKSGRMPSITYAGRDMHYGNVRVRHMVNPIHLDPPDASPRRAAILDNNFVGERQIVWMTAAELRDRWLDMDGGWAIVLLGPSPPPRPQP